MSAFSTPQKSQEFEGLLREFQNFTKEWTHRFLKVNTNGSEPSISSQMLEDLMAAMDQSSLPQDNIQFRIQLFVSSHLHLGLTLKDLSDFLGYSEKYCSEFFRHQLGESFSSYLKRMRIRKAKFLLQNSLISMTEIAEALGFKDQFAFSHFFKKAIGISPRKYRNQIVKQKLETIDRQPYSEIS